jgi:hypothetical protein
LASLPADRSGGLAAALSASGRLLTGDAEDFLHSELAKMNSS